MKPVTRAVAAISCLTPLFLMTAATSSGGQFKITEVYDGTTMRAEGYDEHCLP